MSKLGFGQAPVQSKVVVARGHVRFHGCWIIRVDSIAEIINNDQTTVALGSSIVLQSNFSDFEQVTYVCGVLLDVANASLSRFRTTNAREF